MDLRYVGKDVREEWKGDTGDVRITPGTVLTGFTMSNYILKCRIGPPRCRFEANPCQIQKHTLWLSPSHTAVMMFACRLTILKAITPNRRLRLHRWTAGCGSSSVHLHVLLHITFWLFTCARYTYRRVLCSWSVLISFDVSTELPAPLRYHTQWLATNLVILTYIPAILTTYLSHNGLKIATNTVVLTYIPAIFTTYHSMRSWYPRSTRWRHDTH
jgi:hypothetical protein